MGQQSQVFSGSVHEEKEQSAVRWGIFILAFGLMALLVLAFLTTVRLTGKPILLPVDEESRFAANPELMVVRRYAVSVVGDADTAYLAANPELIVARRYAAPAVGLADTAYLAANPELIIARRYAGPAVGLADTAYLAANPELIIARRYAGPAVG
ncbi:MAG TPA: hypothetical protein VLY63_03590, partial [Anaerolineae bacterium]|nr:hypothetical protein [Anaerolineae bacterium]